MEKFIIRTEVCVDLTKVNADIQFIVNLSGWPKGNQIGLKYRPGGDIWTDSHGSIRNAETDFTEWNPFIPSYIKNCLDRLAEETGEKFGRIRIMRMQPKTGLTVHSDSEHRYHLVIKTNPNSYFFEIQKENTPLGFYIPADSYFYKVDTTRPHFVYNGGHDDRIHVVICALTL